MNPEDARLEALRLANTHSIGTPAEVTARAEAYREFLVGPVITIKEVVKEVLVDMETGKVVGVGPREPKDET